MRSPASNYDDQGPHQMAAVINGQEVKLYLDGKYGTAVRFPFSPVVLQLGSYARANGDTSSTIFDNLKVEAVGTATFSISALTMGQNQTASNLVVRIPPGANADKAIVMQIKNRRPAVATPAGATTDTLTLTFERGGANTKTFNLQALTLGGTQLTLTNTIGLLAGNVLDVTVVKGPTVLLEEAFTGATLDASKWKVSTQPFETATGTFDATQTGGVLQISGSSAEQYWAGASIQTASDFTATKDLPLVIEVDRVSIDPIRPFDGLPSSAARTGVFITSYDVANNSRVAPFVLFAQNVGANGWSVNVAPGSPTGNGTALAAFASLASDTNKHRMKLSADGSKVEVFLDGVSGGTFDFPATAFIKFELGAYARDIDDTVKGVFDNVKIENVFPCMTASPADLLAIQGDRGNSVAVTIPKLLNVSGEVWVTVTSRDPNVAEPEGAANGGLTLNFPTGTDVRSFKVIAKAAGNTVFDLSNDKGACVASGVKVSVTPPPVALLSDDFSAAAIDAGKWKLDTTPLVDTGVATADSGITITNGVARMDVTTETANWPGLTLWTTKSFSATATSPIVFEIDRTKMEYVLVGGDTSKQRTGIWVKNATTNYVFFSDFGSYNAVAAGWQYHRNISRTGDVLIGNPDSSGVYISELNAAKYTDQKNHRMRIVVNGTAAKLYLDGVLGAEVPFPFSEGLAFGFGSYVNFSNGFGNIVHGYWDNAVVHGFPALPPSSRLSASRQGANIVITWTGAGTLQSTDSFDSIKWTDVAPPPAGNSYTITPASNVTQKYYRLRQ
ncbi:MAG: hypothetical protein HY735_04560 [Verrucomicrobia bacterium]|nr:hypothetical protein [Verrucomicrobiota bacterium]